MLDLTKVNKILIIRLSSLGDVLLTTPLVRTFKVRYPNVQIDFLTKLQYQDIFKYNQYINELHLFKENQKELIKNLSRIKYDLIIDLQNNLRSKRICSFIKSKKLVFHKPMLEKFLLVKFKINTFKETIPIPVRYANVLPDFELDGNGLELFIPNEISTKLNNKKNYIGFCPGSRHFTKMWPKEYFIKLGNALINNGFIPVLFGGSSDKQICSEIHNKLLGSINLCNNNNLLQTANDMKVCKVVICNDSGLMHTAAAVKTPVIAIFGSTVKEFGFAPFGVNNLILENNSLSCRPCSHIGLDKCPKNHFKCMLEITPEKIYEEMLKFQGTK